MCSLPTFLINAPNAVANWTSGWQHTSIPPKQKKKAFILSSVILLILVLSAIIWTVAELRRSYTPEEMNAAMAKTSFMTPSEIIKSFDKGGVGEKELARVLNVSRFTIRRIAQGESNPTASLDAALAGLYCDYMLLRSNYLFRCRHLKTYDLWYPYGNPLHETDACEPPS